MSRLSLSQLVLLSIEEQRLALDEINQQLEQNGDRAGDLGFRTSS